MCWCRDNGLYLILDMHDAPGGQTGDNIDDSYGYPWLFESERSQQLFCDIWRSIAERYKDETTILGYELINEPIAPYFENMDELNGKLEALHKRAVKAIREVDTNHIILLGGAQWYGNFKPFTDSWIVLHETDGHAELGSVEYANGEIFITPDAYTQESGASFTGRPVRLYSRQYNTQKYTWLYEAPSQLYVQTTDLSESGLLNQVDGLSLMADWSSLLPEHLLGLVDFDHMQCSASQNGMTMCSNGHVFRANNTSPVMFEMLPSVSLSGDYYIEQVAGVENLAAVPAGAGVALVLISVVLSLVAGLAPSRMAAKKDPVTALRTAVIVAQSLENQKLVLDQIDAVNKTTDAMIDRTSKLLQANSLRTQQQAVSSGVSPETLRRAYDAVFSTLDSIDKFREQANESFSKTIDVLNDQLQRAHAYAERMSVDRGSEA